MSLGVPKCPYIFEKLENLRRFISVSSLHRFLILVGSPLTSTNCLSDTFLITLFGRTSVMYLAGRIVLGLPVSNTAEILTPLTLIMNSNWVPKTLPDYLTYLIVNFFQLMFWSFESILTPLLVLGTSGILATVSVSDIWEVVHSNPVSLSSSPTLATWLLSRFSFRHTFL